MSSVPIRLAVEDALSEAVLRRVLADRPVRYEVGAVYSRGGSGYLRRQTPAFNNAAKAGPFILLTDLDRHECPSELVTTWLAGRTKHHSFLFRVAVREVESWLLGDMARLRLFLHLKTASVVTPPEDLLDPKQVLLRLSLGCRVRRVRDAIVWRDSKSGRLFQGPDYNGTLAEFVAKYWSPPAARSTCPSLERLFSALASLEAELV